MKFQTIKCPFLGRELFKKKQSLEATLMNKEEEIKLLERTIALKEKEIEKLGIMSKEIRGYGKEN